MTHGRKKIFIAVPLRFGGPVLSIANAQQVSEPAKKTAHVAHENFSSANGE
jgi:hypothetical protein